MADSLSALSSLQRAVKHYADAESLAAEALEIAEDRLGPDHPLVARILDNLAAADVHEFAFICLPLKMRGVTGSPVRPLALA